MSDGWPKSKAARRRAFEPDPVWRKFKSQPHPCEYPKCEQQVCWEDCCFPPHGYGDLNMQACHKHHQRDCYDRLPKREWSQQEELPLPSRVVPMVAPVGGRTWVKRALSPKREQA